VFGILAIAGIFIGYGYGIKTDVITSPNSLAPYMRVLVNALYFIALYLVVFTQSVPFSIYEYVKQQGQHE
jgi:formate/nitrite transporter FocA (FNT family)